MTNLLGKSITRNQITGTEQLSQIMFLTTEIGGSVSTANTLRTNTVNRRGPTIQPTIIHLNQATRMGHSERNHFLIGSFNSGIGVPRSRCTIDNHSRMNQQVSIVTTIQESNKAKNCDSLNLFIRMLYLSYSLSMWYGTIKGESEHRVENLRSNNILKC